MSHHYVAVFSRTPLSADVLQEILEPWQPFGAGDQYLVTIDEKDIMEECLREYRDLDDDEKEVCSFAQYLSYAFERPILTEQELSLIHGAQDPETSRSIENGYVLTDAKGDVIKLVKVTNPNEKWNWWTIGGRYSGLFGDTLDLCQIKDIPFEALQMRVPRAFVHEGKWLERASSEGVDAASTDGGKDTWAARWRELIQSLDPDTYVAVVDCTRKMPGIA